jgi:hypothetical protein
MQILAADPLQKSMSATAIPDQPFFAPMLTAVILYDIPELAARSKAALDKIANGADQAIQWTVIPWRVDLLALPSVARAALEDAMDAHLIILAIRQKPNLPPLLIGWLQLWATHRNFKCAALACCPGGREEAYPATAIAELSKFAEHQGLDFIFDPATAPRNLAPHLA